MVKTVRARMGDGRPPQPRLTINGTIAAPTEAFPDTDHFSTLVAQGLVRETVGASEGVLRVQGLVREVIGAPGVGLNRLIVQGLAREVIGVPGAAGVSPKQYAVTVIT